MNDAAGTQVVGVYTLERCIGEGGTGSVWLAHRNDGRFESKVAVKLLKVALTDNTIEQRFQREGRLLVAPMVSVASYDGEVGMTEA